MFEAVAKCILGKKESGWGKGYVLVEVMLIIVMLGILAAVAFPRIGGSKEQHLLEATARTLMVNIRQVQGHAITESYRSEILFSHHHNSYYVELSGEGEWVTLPGKISMFYNNFPEVNHRQTLSFNYLGAPNRGGRVGFKNERGDKLYVIVTPVTGRVRMGSDPP